ncbi:unnamed protein product [Boreogadus saida]
MYHYELDHNCTVLEALSCVNLAEALEFCAMVYLRTKVSQDFEGFDPYYFCFITLTTIGFGDIVPKHPKYFMITSLFIIVGMAIMSMAFKLGQTRIVSFYHTCIRRLPLV